MRKRKYSALSSCNPSFDCLTKEIQYHASNAFFKRMKHAQNACNTYTLNLLHNLSHSHRDDDPVTKTLDNQPQAQIHNIFQKNMFPGLIYRANNCPVVLLLFHSGKVVITGGKSVDDIFNGWNMLWTHVKQYIENN